VIPALLEIQAQRGCATSRSAANGTTTGKQKLQTEDVTPILHHGCYKWTVKPYEVSLTVTPLDGGRCVKLGSGDCLEWSVWMKLLHRLAELEDLKFGS
jgi:hypothetical protein